MVTKELRGRNRRCCIIDNLDQLFGGGAIKCEISEKIGEPRQFLLNEIP